MTETQFALVVVGVLFIGSNIFWAWQTQTLINKLMSRNYFEFKEATLRADKKPKTMTEQQFVDDMGAVNEIFS